MDVWAWLNQLQIDNGYTLTKTYTYPGAGGTPVEYAKMYRLDDNVSKLVCKAQARSVAENIGNADNDTVTDYQYGTYTNYTAWNTWHRYTTGTPLGYLYSSYSYRRKYYVQYFVPYFIKPDNYISTGNSAFYYDFDLTSNYGYIEGAVAHPGINSGIIYNHRSVDYSTYEDRNYTSESMCYTLTCTEFIRQFYASGGRLGVNNTNGAPDNLTTDCCLQIGYNTSYRLYGSIPPSDTSACFEIRMITGTGTATVPDPLDPATNLAINNFRISYPKAGSSLYMRKPYMLFDSPNTSSGTYARCYTRNSAGSTLGNAYQYSTQNYIIPNGYNYEMTRIKYTPGDLAAGKYTLYLYFSSASTTKTVGVNMMAKPVLSLSKKQPVQLSEVNKVIDAINCSLDAYGLNKIPRMKSGDEMNARVIRSMMAKVNELSSFINGWAKDLNNIIAKPSSSISYIKDTGEDLGTVLNKILDALYL